MLTTRTSRQHARRAASRCLSPSRRTGLTGRRERHTPRCRTWPTRKTTSRLQSWSWEARTSPSGRRRRSLTRRQSWMRRPWRADVKVCDCVVSRACAKRRKQDPCSRLASRSLTTIHVLTPSPLVRAIILGELRDDSRVVPRVRRIRDVSEMVWTHNDMSVK